MLHRIVRVAVPLILFSLFLFPALIGLDAQGAAYMSGALGISATALTRLLAIGLLLSGAYLLDTLLRMDLWEALLAGVPRDSIANLLPPIATALIYLAALAGILGVAGNAPLPAVFGVVVLVAVVLGIALRALLLDVFSGIAFGFDRSFRVGDWVQVERAGLPTFTARVESQQWRVTQFWTRENSQVIVPNGELARATVLNLSRPAPGIEHDITVQVDWDVPVDRVMSILRSVGMAEAGDNGILTQPSPAPRIAGVDGHRVVYRLVFHFDMASTSLARARSVLYGRLLEEMDHAGVSPAIPRQDVFHARRPDRRLDDSDPRHRQELLARVPLFAGLTREELERLSSWVVVRTFAEFDEVVRSGDFGDSMFVLTEGLLHVFVDGLNGAQVRVGQVLPGDFFGEMSLLTGEPRSATVRAVTPSRCFEITKPVIASLLARRSAIAERIAFVVADRQRGNAALLSEDSPKRDVATHVLANEILGKLYENFRGR